MKAFQLTIHMLSRDLPFLQIFCRMTLNPASLIVEVLSINVPLKNIDFLLFFTGNIVETALWMVLLEIGLSTYLPEWRRFCCVVFRHHNTGSWNNSRSVIYKENSGLAWNMATERNHDTFLFIPRISKYIFCKVTATNQISERFLAAWNNNGCYSSSITCQPYCCCCNQQ